MTLEAILRFLHEHKEEIHTDFSVEKLGIFGSHAKGEASPSSDIDLFVVFSHKSFRNLTRLYDYLEKAFNTKVDIVSDHKHMRPALRREIEKSIIYG